MTFILTKRPNCVFETTSDTYQQYALSTASEANKHSLQSVCIYIYVCIISVSYHSNEFLSRKRKITLDTERKKNTHNLHIRTARNSPFKFTFCYIELNRHFNFHQKTICLMLFHRIFLVVLLECLSLSQFNCSLTKRPSAFAFGEQSISAHAQTYTKSLEESDNIIRTFFSDPKLIFKCFFKANSHIDISVAHIQTVITDTYLHTQKYLICFM